MHPFARRLLERARSRGARLLESASTTLSLIALPAVLAMAMLGETLDDLLRERRDVEDQLDGLGGRTRLASEQRTYDRLLSTRTELGSRIETAVATLPLDQRALQVVQANFSARRGIVDRLRSLDEAAAGRAFTGDERAQVDGLTSEIGELDNRIAAMLDQEVRQQQIGGATDRLLGRLLDTDRARVDETVLPTLEHRVTDWANEHGYIRPEERGMSLAKWLRGAVTGDWTDADLERRAMSEGVLAGGGYMVPTPLAAQIIDRARNAARVFQAGAVTVPMATATLKLARVAGDPTAAWHTENAAITPSDMTLEGITLTARTLTSLVTASRELIEDAPNAEQALMDAFAAQLALSLDLASLYGSGTPPEPRGVKNATGVTLTANGTDGTAIGTLKYNVIADAIGVLWAQNEEPTGAILAPRTELGLGKLTDSTTQPLQPPPMVAGVRRLTTNQVPVNLTVGTSTDTSDIFVADWRQLLIGVRHTFQIDVLRERFADNFQLGFLAHLRADVLVARPKAFVVSSGVRP